MTDLLQHERALVVAAHPDDEVLGCGGTVARLADAKTSVHVAFLADGVSSRGSGAIDDAELRRRRSAAQAACDALGVTSVSFGDFPDNSLDTVPMLELARAVEQLVEAHTPSLVLTHHAGDLNVDHQRLHAAVATACRPQRGHPVQTILAFEIPSSTEWQTAGPPFVPNYFVDISATLERKLTALRAYTMEMREWPHPRSLRAVEDLARWRGATVGAQAVEGFMLARHLA